MPPLNQMRIEPQTTRETCLHFTEPLSGAAVLLIDFFEEIVFDYISFMIFYARKNDIGKIAK